VSSPCEEWQLDTRRLGRRVLVFAQTDSTNTRAGALADDRANDGLVILADQQTAGRGQHGRTWLSWPGTGVLLSALLFPPPPLRRPAVLTAWAAVSVCETILRATGLQARIKWPNDVLIRGRKVCGILIEQARGTVVGIGLNVNQQADTFAAAELTEAGSLAVFAERTFDVREIARLLIRQLDEEYDLLHAGDFAGLEARWKRRLGLLGKQVTAECHDRVHRGRLLDVAFEHVELETADQRLHLLPETILHLDAVRRLSTT
jgi:BirA family biotin operon repressor/biotin-[acetyl-CoA-carboxylase] ligase